MKEALDSARAALRGGASEVTIVSLETFDEMPVLKTTQGHEEFEEAKKEGVSFKTRLGPKAFLGSGRLAAIELKRVLSVFDESGRFSPAYDETEITTLEADGCILAIGQSADLGFLKPGDGVALAPGGTIRVDPETLATSAPGVFAGGDVAFGPRNLIEAVANGKRAARSMHRYLSGEAAAVSAHLSIEKIPTPRYRMIAGFEVFDRETPPTLDVGRRTGIAEVETGYGEEEARRQAARCLICHVQTIYDPEKCVLCSRCVDICPEYCLAIVPFADLDLDEAARQELSRAGGGERAAALGDGQGRRPVHPVRPLRDALPDRRHDDGEVLDHGAVRRGRGPGFELKGRPWKTNRRPAGGSCSSSSGSEAASPRSRARPWRRCGRSFPTSPTTRRRRSRSGCPTTSRTG